MSDSATTSASPPSRTIGEILSIKEQQLAMAKGRAKQTLQEQVDAYRDLTEQYHSDTPFSRLPDQEKQRHYSRRVQGSGSTNQEVGRMGGLVALGQLALERPISAIALALALAALYPLEQYAVNRAAYFGNPATQQQARQLELDNAVKEASNKTALAPLPPCFGDPNSQQCEDSMGINPLLLAKLGSEQAVRDYARHGAADGVSL